MQKKINLITLLVIGFVLPSVALAVNFSNPATDFFIDLRSFGSDNTFKSLIVYLINLVLGIVGVLSIAFIIYGGFQYITSRGNEEQADAGKKTLTNAIMGLIIVTLSYTLVIVIENALRNKP